MLIKFMNVYQKNQTLFALLVVSSYVGHNCEAVSLCVHIWLCTNIKYMANKKYYQ